LSYSRALILSNTAYDVALTIRFAETYGLGSRAHSTGGNTGYGLHFQSGVADRFTLFADTYPAVGTADHSPADDVCHEAPTYDPEGPSALAGNCVYEEAEGERVQDYILGNGITIYEFCALAGSWSCSETHGGGLASLDLVFARPNPTPFMSKDGAFYAGAPVEAACITLTSPQGEFKHISIGSSGQISANAAPCSLLTP
jgi:hypothetical protein